MTLVLQAVLALLMIGAAFLMTDAPRTMRLYLWSAVIPIGFGLVFWRAYARGERERSAGTWTIEWERREARRAFQLLGVVALVWALGLVVVGFVL
jgi:O-antigen/teichoic acid export membrane protein